MSNRGEKGVAPALKIFSGDRLLWIIIAVLAVISVLVVYSSTAKMAYDAQTIRSSSQFLRQQLFVLILGAIVLFATHKIDCRFFRRFSRLLYGLSLIATVATYFIGTETNGAARWILIMGFQFQPSEALKVATVLLLANQLAVRQDKIANMRLLPTLNIFKWALPEQKRILKEGTLPIIVPVLASCAVIFPAHFSSTIIVFAASLVMMLIGRVQLRELWRLVLVVVCAALLLMSLNLGRSSTASGRFDTWIDSWTTSYDVENPTPVDKLSDTQRSMIAIHNGNVLGKGAGQSVMRVVMTHPESDYAYAFFVEEYGLIMGIILMMLYLWIFFRAMEIFRGCSTAFPGLLVLGLAVLITGQALLHIAVTVNILPETGQPLPIISRGGSSVIFTAAALGMILSISRQNDDKTHTDPKKESILER